MRRNIIKTPKTLSYSSFTTFVRDQEEFYCRYLAETKTERLPQTDYMSIGSAFDAYAKSELHAAVFGLHTDPNFEFEKLFTEQVEEHNRSWAIEHGKYVLDCYKQSGAYQELLDLLLVAIEPPRFESTLEGSIDGVPFLGKPDLFWKLQFPGQEPVRIVFDFKCKGYCSKSGPSPSKGYALCRDGYDAIALKLNATKKVPEGKQSASHNTCHDNYLAYNHRGLTINQGYMEACNQDYADQVSLYGWLLGEKPGDENVVVWIDELVCKAAEPRPPIRVANHRARVSRDHQLKLLQSMKACWNAITSGHIFTDMSREDSDSRCEILEKMSVGLKTDGTDAEAWFSEVTRTQKAY